MLSVSGLMLASVIWAQAQAQTLAAPIVQPGAPGAASRVITAAEAAELSRSTYTSDDVAFMQHMIVHHGQAVEMVALLDAQGSDPTIKLLGRRISLSQQAEIALMRGWLTDRGEPVGMAMGDMDHSAHAGHAAMAADDTPLMPGMLSPAQMRTLAAAQGSAFDRLFLQGMIRHHQGALDMVGALMETPDAAQDTVLSDFTSAVVADQSAEILRMRSLLSELPNP